MSSDGSRFDSQLRHTISAVIAHILASLTAYRGLSVPNAYRQFAPLRLVLVFVPVVLPFVVSFMVYSDRNDPTRQSHRLSSDINLILFTLITAASYALVRASCVQSLVSVCRAWPPVDLKGFCR